MSNISKYVALNEYINPSRPANSLNVNSLFIFGWLTKHIILYFLFQPKITNCVHHSALQSIPDKMKIR